MNFFASQDDARKKTKLLVFFFVMAVIVLITLTNILFMVATGYINTETIVISDVINNFDWKIFFIIGAGVLLLVGISSLY